MIAKLKRALSTELQNKEVLNYKTRTENKV